MNTMPPSGGRTVRKIADRDREKEAIGNLGPLIDVCSLKIKFAAINQPRTYFCEFTRFLAPLQSTCQWTNGFAKKRYICAGFLSRAGPTGGMEARAAVRLLGKSLLDFAIIYLAVG